MRRRRVCCQYKREKCDKRDSEERRGYTAAPEKPIKESKKSTMADRLNLSAGQRTAFMAAVVSEGGADLKTVTVKIKYQKGR